MTRGRDGNPDGAPADRARGARILLPQTQMQRLLPISAAGFLALPFPQEPPTSTLAGPPDELTCLNDDVGRLTVGEVMTLSDTPQTRSSTRNLSCDRSRNWELYPTVILAGVDSIGSQDTQRMSK
jgi:hypothetical protein